MVRKLVMLVAVIFLIVVAWRTQFGTRKPPFLQKKQCVFYGCENTCGERGKELLDSYMCIDGSKIDPTSAICEEQWNGNCGTTVYLWSKVMYLIMSVVSLYEKRI